MSSVAIQKSCLQKAIRNKISSSRTNLNITRCLALHPKQVPNDEPMHPNYNINSIKPPKNYYEYHYKEGGDEPRDPMAIDKKDPTSAYSVDVGHQKLCARDSAWVDEHGTVVHGKYGALSGDIVSSIPLEYLPLLGNGADGAAAVREMLAKAKGKDGTMIVFGANEASGLAAVQLGTEAGLAVVGVVGGEQSGSDEVVDIMKNFTKEPGFVVGEEYALMKKNFQDLVMQTVSGEEIDMQPNVDEFIKDFHGQVVDYAAMFPAGKPAIFARNLEFEGKDKDRKYYDENWEAYYEDSEPGSPSFSSTELEANFTKDTYALFKYKFAKQGEMVMADDPEAKPFYPANEVKNLCNTSPQSHVAPDTPPDASGKHYFFNIMKPHSTPTKPTQRPILGTVLVSTPFLHAACTALANTKTLREKAETLAYLPDAQRSAYAAAASCVALAKKQNAPVYVIGSTTLPGLPEPLEPTSEDVNTALNAMQLDEAGKSKLNFLVQVYRAIDFPIYEQYAIHRASEVCAGPRQAIVVK